MQVLLGGTNLRKLTVCFCEVSAEEISELVQLVREKPTLLPKIVCIRWCFDVDKVSAEEMRQHKLLLQTFEDTFPQLELLTEPYS
jgi:hypothetical protein